MTSLLSIPRKYLEKHFSAHSVVYKVTVPQSTISSHRMSFSIQSLGNLTHFVESNYFIQNVLSNPSSAIVNLSSAISLSVNGLITQAVAALFLRTLLRIGGTFVSQMIFTELQFQYLNFLYYLKLIKRFQTPVPQEREILQFLIGSIAPIAIGSLADEYILEHHKSKVVQYFDPISLFVVQLSLLFMIDTWYHFGQ
jgi:hypothetical protein